MASLDTSLPSRRWARSLNLGSPPALGHTSSSQGAARLPTKELDEPLRNSNRSRRLEWALSEGFSPEGEHIGLKYQICVRQQGSGDCENVSTECERQSGTLKRLKRGTYAFLVEFVNDFVLDTGPDK